MKKKLSLIIIFTLFLTMSVTLLAAPEGLTFQGRLIDNNVAVESNPVALTLTIKSPGANECILFQETHTLNMNNSDGIFSVKIGGGTRTGSDEGFTMSQVFSNTGSAINSLSCANGATSYTSSSTDSRNIYVSFNDNGNVVSFSAPYVIQSVPYALESQKLAGKSASDFLQTVSALETTPGTTQARMSRIVNTDYNVLDALINGTSNKYMTSSSTEGTSLPVLSAQPTLSAGKIWYEGGAIKYYDAVSTTVKTLGTSGGSVTSVATGTGLSGGPITSTGTISLASGVISTPGTYRSVTVDTYGRVTAGTTPTTLAEYGITDAVLKGGQAGALTLGTSDANSLTFNTNNTAKMSILSDGKVGIGTASPSTTLDVSGDVRATGNVTIANGSSSSSSPRLFGISASSSGNYARFTFESNNAAGIQGGYGQKFQIYSWHGIELSGGQGAAGPSFANGGAASDTNVLVINRGNSSGTTLAVQPKASQTANLQEWRNSSGTALSAVTPAGQLGIGTATPNSKLEVNGNITLTAAGGQTVTTAGTELVLQQTGDTYGATSLKLRNRAGSNGAVFQNSGLDLVDFGFLASGGSQNNLRYENRSAYLLNSSNTTGEMQLLYGTQSGASGTIYMGFGPSVTTISSSKVGIGTSSPQATLDVNGTVRLAANSAQPAACASANSGTVALTSSYRMCVCNGTAWVYTSDGSSACSW